ncbi:ABC transporter permease [Verrucomicrobiaceae bacterium 5K15]|uniref:ABC transporter permease n=1 Tax=Oceaniferula flava TaxID=2800421 RepID=A0AAE2SG64_9BACT|nr:ABC transporter permease [Oceaniferula flavus]MBK1856367.1 ABC transporter permease [Oceaniferula flavus]MBM1137674.1 ABC transporter permease [Oceaniferula flavus]
MSVITLISLAGVAIGVMVLVVVLSVFGGFEKLVKERVLSYTPHITIERVLPWADPEEEPDHNIEAEWRRVEQSMTSLKGVESAYALVNDFILLDRDGAVAPASMQAIDTMNESQMKSLQDLIKPGNGHADMGLGETAVVSSLTAEKFGINVGDTIQIHTNRNLQQLQPVLDRIGSAPAYTTYAEQINAILADMKSMVTTEDERETVPITALEDLYYNRLVILRDSNLRSGESEIIESVREQLTNFKERTTEHPDASGVFVFEKGAMAKAIELFESLKAVDTKEEDITDVKQMKTIVLPKDLRVIGIYQATRHAYSPDVFVPLPTGQDLAGLGDGVRGIALRLDDPYHAARVLNETILKNMPTDGAWQARTWMEDHQQQFSLIKTQRQLLTFSLSFIMMVSAFSIMAVMFTVTIQKKREIGVMKALGAAPAQLVRVFLYQGIIIGLFGGLLGLGFGYLVIVNRQSILNVFASWGFDPFPSDFNGFDGLPAIIRAEEFLGVFIFAFVMCVVATLVPAIVASRSDAAKSLRNM